MTMLIDEMKDALPLFAYPTTQLIETLSDLMRLCLWERKEIQEMWRWVATKPN